MARKKRSAAHHCGMCTQSFTSRADLNLHTQNHEDNGPTELTCQMCGWPFPDSLALEQHKITSGHGTPRYSCHNCSKGFITPRGLEDHVKPPGCPKALAGISTGQPSLPPHPHPPRPDPPIKCDRCANTFRTRQEYRAHRSYQQNTSCADHNHKTPRKNRVGYDDLDKPKDNVLNRVLGYDNSSDGEVAYNSDSDTPTNMSDSEMWCSTCKNKFASLAQYNAHCMWCASKHGSNNFAPVVRGSAPSVASKTSEVIQPSPSPIQQHENPKAQTRASNGSRFILGLQQQLPLPAPAPTQASPSPTPSASGSASFACNINGCQKTFRSEAGLKVHKTDAHGVGGKPLDLYGKDSWILTQRMREQLRVEGLLKAPSGPSRGRGQGGRGSSSVVRLPPPPVSRPPQPTSRLHHPSGPHPIPFARLPPQGPVHHAHQQAPMRHAPMHTPAPLPTSQNMGGAYEMEQAKYIQGKILRLLIQANVFIHHDGKMNVCDIDWTRIGVEKQHDVIGMFDGMCHLPKILQGEYLPPPKAFSGDYKIQYPASDFKPSPPHDRSKPGLGVVAIACSKVVLSDGLQEVVKIAAVDLVTCRILMDHLVCTNPKAQVENWRSNETGLFSWNDMEQARKLGYKIFRGWSAARSALHKFVDKETIIVGHNLRSDLDSLRMVHGRAVDIAKVAEKTAKGPLSKAQLALDSLCRSYPTVMLKNDPEYGRDVLVNAFAVREMGLWVIKNRDKFEKDIRQKSRDYEAVMPRTAVAA